MNINNWFDIVRHYTEQLVAIRSVSPGQGEIQAAQTVLDLLRANEFQALYTTSGLDPVEDDPYGRQNAYAFLRGEHPLTLVLLGHVDTVDTNDYGSLEQWALAPQELAARLDTLLSPAPQLEEDGGDWMYGRGVADMKSGVAVNIAL